MKKHLISLVLLFIISFNSDAQKIKFGIGPVLATPLGGHLSDINKYGYGAEIDIAFRVSNKVEIFSQLGVQKFIGKTFTVTGMNSTSNFKNKTLDHLQFLLGGRYLMGNLFGGFGVGYASFSTYDSGLSYSPQIGYRIPKIDFILDYTSSKIEQWNFSTVGLTGIYHF